MKHQQILPRETLLQNSIDYVDPTDQDRLDGHADKTCVTFTYPNPFYLDTARKRPQFREYRDWVILLIKAEILNRDGVLFCERNAAACGGTLLKAGARGLEGCFADMVHGERTRGLTHHPRAATDLQAEALVPGPIPLAFVMNIVTPTNEAAGNAWARLQAADLNPDQFTWLVSKICSISAR